MRSKVVNKEKSTLVDRPEYRPNRALQLLVKMTRAEEVPQTVFIEIISDPFRRKRRKAEYFAKLIEKIRPVRNNSM
jgi:hypothetical protein